MKASIFSLAVAAVGLAGLASPTAAQGSDKDVRCVILSNIFAQAEKEPAKKQVAAAAGLYFLGRADARLLPTQFKAAVLGERKALTPQNAGAGMTACAQSFIARQRALKAMGQELMPAPIKK